MTNKKPRSPRQLQASIANGSKSKGPKTPEGKSRLGGTNLRHGFYARAVVLDGESTARFKNLLATFSVDHEPKTRTQELIVEKMAVIQWRLMRIWSYQRATVEMQAATLAESHPSRHALLNDVAAYDTKLSDTLLRHEITLERQFSRCQNQLEKLKNLMRTQQVAQNKDQDKKSEPGNNPAETQADPGETQENPSETQANPSIPEPSDSPAH
jgi:hypothetical protein